MRIKFSFILCLFTFFCFSQDWKTYPYLPTGEISFPLDEGRHSTESSEWWYSTGHVVGQTSGTNYSFMCTFFYNPAGDFDGFRILNITNDDTGEFFQDVKPVNYTTLSTTSFDIEATVFLGGTESWKNKLDVSNQPIPFEYELFSANGTGGLSLEFVTTKRPLILGDDGFFNQGLASYTYYYSQTMNTISGDLTFNGVTEAVVGTGWIDRQYGSFNPFSGEKYEWFSMQLSNGMDLNLWNIFTVDNETPTTIEYRNLSAYVDEATQYTTNDFQIERLEYFCTSDEEMCYSKQWRLTSNVNNIDLIISTLHTTTEVQLPFRFFEGSTTISGTINGVAVTGKGFAELLHSYENPDLTLTSPVGGVYDASMPISWDLNNPDDGRPIQYDIEYSIDNQANFLPLVQGLTDTSYLWTNPSITNGDEVWFKIIGYSIDGTLTSEIISASSSSATLSVNQFDITEVKFYPNPVKNELNVSFTNAIVEGYYEIFDITGRSVMSYKIDTNDLLIVDMSSFNSGLYFIKIKGINFETVYRFIKQ